MSCSLLQIQLLLIAVMVLAIGGGKFGIWSPLTGFYLSILSVAAIVVVSGISGVKLLLINRETCDSSSLIISLLLGVIPFLLMILTMKMSDFSKPMIHDITTDLDNPPLFIKAYERRAASDNNLDYDQENLVSQQRQAYPEIEPLILDNPLNELFAIVLQRVESNRWDVLNADKSTNIIEAVDETLLFGFKDDVIIRLEIQPNGKVRIDMRSASRVGKGDLGANARRIQHFLADLRNHLNQ